MINCFQVLSFNLNFRRYSKVTAFNFPYAVFGWGALPALAAGNGVIWKPHPDAALTAMVRRCRLTLSNPS
jgi:hypothetical protein